MQTGVPGDDARPQKPRSPAVAAMLQPHTPNMTWQYIDWLKGSCNLPIVVKGILTAEDVRLAVVRAIFSASLAAIQRAFRRTAAEK